MKRLIAVTVFSFLTLLATAQSKAEAQVLKNVEALNKAIFLDKNAAVIESLVSKDLNYGHSSGSVEDMAKMVSNATSNKTVYNAFAVEDMKIDVVGKNAIVRHTLRSPVVDNGSGAPLNIAVLQVWTKEGKNWHLLARQAVKVSPKN